ncbi:MAG TPA: DUF2079 domain-containing protein, partial [Anaerolineae bacterium]|nr:DUF2079 domain-containing protein [Anaerolineae bacterium]
VEPILLPVALLYRLYPKPETLFIIQTVVVALGAIPVYALARYKLQSEWLGLVFALVFLMFPAIQGATLLDFHAVTMAPTFLLAAFFYLERRRPGRFALFAALAIACKEDMTLLVLMMGLYALLINRQYRLGLTTLGLCLAWAALAVFVIPPLFAGTDNIHWDRYGHLGDSPLDIVLNLVRRPWLFSDHLRAVNALDYLRLLLSPTAFLALLNPITLLLALPSLGINLLSSFPPMQRVNSLIYAAPLVPAVMISSIYGAANLKRWLGRLVGWKVGRLEGKKGGRLVLSEAGGLEGWRTGGLEIFETDSDSALTSHAPSPTLLLNSLIGALILTASLLYHLYYGFLPGGGQYRGWEAVTDHHRRAERIFNQIPPEAKLSAMDRLNPHVSQRETLYIFDRIDNADHILLDVTLDSWPLHPVALRQRVDQFLEQEGFGVVDAYDGYLLLAKNPALPAKLPDEFFDFVRVDDPNAFTPAYPADVVFADKLHLIGYSLGLGAHEKFLPTVTLYWRALEPLDQNYTLWPFFINRQGQVIENPAERPLVATLWYPPSQWSPAEIIATSTLPWDLAPAVGDQFTLALGVAAGDWSDPDRRLPITQTGDHPIYENGTWVRLNTFQRTGRKSYQPVSESLPPPEQPRQATFLEIIDLTGVDLPASSLQPGDSLRFTLYWQSKKPLTIDLTTFAHLLDNQQNVVAQLDWQPQDPLGYRPTSAWQPGQPVIDRQTLPLPANLQPGEYHLVVGWYYPPTGERLPLTTGSASPAASDVVDLGSVTVR